jgi:Ca2+-transporting ATPase
MSEKIGTRHPEEDVQTPEVAEFPFESERKRMSSVREIGGEYFLALKGGTDSVLSISKKIYRDGELVEMTDEDRDMIQEVKEEFSREALRVLALAWRPLGSEGQDWKEEEVERDVTFLGLVGMIDPPRDGVEEAIDECRQAHIDTFMITGDHATTAKAIGLEIGLARHEEETQVIAGAELKDMSDDELVEAMSDERGLVFSRVEPRDKLRIVKLLEDRMGKVVAVTGDGVNDAPALKRAHIGVAMGQTGTDVAKEAAQVVLLDDSFPTLVHAVEEGRTIYNNIRKVVLASLTTNTAELVAVLLGLVGMIMGNWAIPILAIQILAIDLLAEIMPLTFLCFDPPTPELMKEPPRSREDHILNLGTGTEVAILGCLIGGLAVGNYFLYMHRHGLELLQGDIRTLGYFRASTMTWLTIAYCQFVNILSRRYRYTSIFNRNILTNRILFGSVVISMALVLAGVYLPGLSDFLQFADITLVDWLYVWGAAGIFLAVWEGIKAVRRSRRPGEAPA